MTSSGADRIRQLGEECFRVEDFSISTEIDDERTAAGFAVAMAASMHAEGDLGDETHSQVAVDVNAVSGLLLTLDLKSLIDGLTPVPNSEGNLRDWPDTRTLSLKQRKALEVHVSNWEALETKKSNSRQPQSTVPSEKTTRAIPTFDDADWEWFKTDELAEKQGLTVEDLKNARRKVARIQDSDDGLTFVDALGNMARRKTPRGHPRYAVNSCKPS